MALEPNGHAIFEFIYCTKCLPLLPLETWSSKCDLVKNLTSFALVGCQNSDYMPLVLLLSNKIITTPETPENRSLFNAFISLVFQLGKKHDGYNRYIMAKLMSWLHNITVTYNCTLILREFSRKLHKLVIYMNTDENGIIKFGQTDKQLEK